MCKDGNLFIYWVKYSILCILLIIMLPIASYFIVNATTKKIKITLWLALYFYWTALVFGSGSKMSKLLNLTPFRPP